MKEETKKKLCKISKIVGFAITFGFAVFGALCAAMLIGNGSKKDDIKTLDSSLVQNEVRSERNSKPRNAPDYSGSINYLDVGDSQKISNIYISDGTFYYQENYFNTICLELDNSALYYLASGDNAVLVNSYTASLPVVLHELNDLADSEKTASVPETLGVSSGSYGASSRYMYLPAGVYSFSYVYWASPYLYLADSGDLPASSSVYLGENWNPLKAFGDTLSEKGGYLLTDESWSSNTQTFKTLSISGLLFRYEGVVYDRIFMYARPLNALAYPYVDSSGAIVERPITQSSGPNEIYVLDYVSFRASFLNNSGITVMVGGKADTPSPSGKLPYNGSLQWVTSSRSIEIIDDYGITTGRYDNRFASMTDLEFINMLAQYDSEAIDVVNGGQMFGLFTNAFDALTPILSIAILPNITLGMILFIPLVGGIIVVIIRLVKK